MDIRINLNTTVKTLSGLPQEGGETLGRILSSNLGQSQEGNPIKMYNWATKLWASEPIVVDGDDYKQIESFIKDGKTALNNIVKAQILEVMVSSKEAAEKKDEAKSKK
jgi:hypothetical protein